jgi:hypothetical protein
MSTTTTATRQPAPQRPRANRRGGIMVPSDKVDRFHQAIGIAPLQVQQPSTTVAERPDAQQKTQVLTEASKSQKVANATLLAGLPAGDEADAIREILTQHAKAVPEERKAFKGIDYLDDTARITNPDERKTRLEAIQKTLDAVATRRRALADAIKAMPPIDPSDKVGTASLNEARGQLTTIDLHLPDEFQGMSAAEVKRRLATKLATPDQKEQMLQEAKDGFKDENGNDISASFGKAFKDTMEPASAKSFERQRFYFDQFVSAPPPEKLQEIGKITDRIVEQGQRILDCGGSLKDVEALMAKTGIPKDWWPPRFVDTLQAWRKTERAMMQERVAEQFKKLPSLDDTGDTIEQIKSFGEMFCATLPEGVAKNSDKINEFLKNDLVTEPIKQFLEGLANGFGLGEVGFAALQSLAPEDFEKTNKQKLLDGFDTAMELLKGSIGSAVSALKVADSCGAHVLSSVVPGLSLAKCGIDLALAVKKLGEHTAIRVQTGLMKKDAIKQLGSGENEDGGAFLSALGNEIRGRNKQITKDGIEVTTKSMDLAGAAAGTFGGHYGLAAQGGLKIVSGTITLGSKVVFTNIDWAEANRAKKMLEEARAGNPVARMEIFKESNTYAKMYVCLLVRDGNPLAEKFIVQRGIEEPDVEGAMAIKLLREALLDSADQKAEDDIPDSLLMANTGKVGEYTAKIGKAIGNAPRAIADKLKDRSIAYDPSWEFQGAVVLTEKGYDAVKKDAVAAGLFDQPTGIGDALKKLEKEAADTLKLLPGGQPKQLSIESKEGKALQKQLLDAIGAVDDAYGTINSYTPLANPKDKKTEPHKGMSMYCGQLLQELRIERNRYDQLLRDCGLKNSAWQPALSSNPMDPDTWITNWANGIKFACLPSDDGGMGKALAAAAKAAAEIEKSRSKPQALRTAQLDYSETLNDVIAAAKDCRTQAAEVPAMASYLERALADAATKQRDNDSQLGGVGSTGGPKWTKPEIPPDAITAQAWEALWKEAAKGGFVSDKAGDGGVLDAIKKMEKLKEAVEKALPTGGKPLLKARQDYALAAGEILLAKEKFLKVQRDVAAALNKTVINAYTRAMNQVAEYDDARSEVNFTITGGITAAAWEATYKDAVDKGAVPAAKKAADALSDALKDTASAIAKVEKSITGKKFEDALKQAHEAGTAIDAAIQAIDAKLMAADGYADNKRMGIYLSGQLRPMLQNLKKADPLAAALAGNAAGGQFGKQSFTLLARDFSATKKSAIELGVIADQKTGMSGALGDLAKANTALETAKAKRQPDPAEVKKVHAAAFAAAQKLGRLSKNIEELSENANWVAYAKAAQNTTAEYLKRIGPVPT